MGLLLWKAHLRTETKDHIMELLKPDYIEGFSLLGGEPFEPENQEELVDY